jgi:hypothetical protein
MASKTTGGDMKRYLASDSVRRLTGAQGEGEVMSLREIWRSIVLYGLFAALVYTGFEDLPELPDRATVLPLYILIASAAVPMTIAHFWR